MKNWYKTIAFVAVIAFSFAALSLTGCDNGMMPGTDPGGEGANQTPTADDFNISGTGAFTYDGEPKNVTVTAQGGKTAGAVTVRYNGSPAAPSAVGAYKVTFDVAGVAGWNAARGLSAGTLTISKAATIITDTLPNGVVGTPYSHTLAAAGQRPIAWSIESGELPDGLSLLENTIAGTPTTEGTSTFTVKAANDEGEDTRELSITVTLTGGDSIDDPIPLTEDTWADGSIATGGGQQWFTFEATASAQYLHVAFGTLNSSWGMYAQVYDSDGAEVGSEAYLSDSIRYASRTLTPGETYYIKVRPFNSSYRGAYRIAFNTSITPPGVNSIPLIEDTWEDGDLATPGEQHWFSFEATAATQYLHVDFGTLNSSLGAYAQVYDSGGAAAGSETRLTGAASYTTRTLTSGDTYYIRVRPHSNGGTYQIAYNKTNAAPSFQPPPNPIPLTEGAWADGSIATTSDRQWFIFEATASAQSLHVEFGTLANLYAQVYDSDGAVQGSETYLYDSTRYTSRTGLTIGQTYFIRVRPYNGVSGTYRITFNTTLYPPGTATIPLTEGQWEDGSIPTSGDWQWYTFEATAATQYLHVAFGTLTNLYAQAYDSGGAEVGSETRFNAGSATRSASQTLTAGQTYYIRVRSNTGVSGTYRIGFNTTPYPPDTTFTPLTLNTWANGSLPILGDWQWFTFEATAATQYLHVEFDALNNLYVNVYDSGGAEVGSETQFNTDSTIRSASRTLTSGQTYYIRVRPYSGGGTYRIAFNTSIIPPGTIPLTLDQWENGSIATAGGQQWFSFTATAATQYLHVDFGTLANLYAQVYNSSGAVVTGGETQLTGATRSTTRTLTANQTYYIRVRPYSGSGAYRIGFSAKPYPPDTTFIELTADQWADGSIATANDNQWFSFTANAAAQSLLVEFGTLANLYVHVYDSNNAAVGSEAQLTGSAKSASRALTAGNTYYIRVRPNTGVSGDYRIRFSAAPYPPGTEPIPLTEGQWEDGSLPANGEQWFIFEATAATQYLHVAFGTLANLYVNVYTSTGALQGSETQLSGTTRYASRTGLTAGQTYYIKVRPNGTSSGAYRIAFNMSIILPGPHIPLTEGQWEDGSLPTANDIQWFSFTATAATQYLHIALGTLTDLYVNVYNSSGTVVGSGETNIYSSSTNKYTTRTLTIGQTYYIRVRPYSATGNGTYRIGFTKTIVAPEPTPLTENQWENGSLSASTSEQWFSFTATAATQYIHAASGTMNWSSGGVSVQVYTSAGATQGAETRLTTNISRASLTIGQTYYIRVRPYNSSYTGTYWIAFNATVYPPGTAFIPLTADTWADGDLPTASDQQWFSFTATADTQYIHAAFGSMNSSSGGIYAQVYDSAFATSGSETRLYSSAANTSRTGLTAGDTYYIRARPYDSSYTGTYRIAFNASGIPPGATFIPLTADTWVDGNLPTYSDVQWFSFTATADTQYIHAVSGTMSWVNGGIFVQVYTSAGAATGSETRLDISTLSTSRTGLTAGQTYYIRVRPYNGVSGTYRIAFNATPYPPDTTFIPLTEENRWADGNLPSSSSQQWFSFTATEATQYIHAAAGTTGTIEWYSGGIYAQVYDSAFATSGGETRLYDTTRSTSRTGLTAGQTYYIRVRPYSNYYTGTYRIGFNTSTTAPVFPSGFNPIPLTAGQWADGDLPTSNDMQWFSFTATESTHYLHASFGTLAAEQGVYVQMYTSAATSGSETRLYLYATSTSRASLTVGDTYYIRVRPYSSTYYTGTYRIAFGGSIVPPGAIPLTENEWKDGNIATVNGQQWFSFTATAATQYIHADFGTLKELYVNVYNSSDAVQESETLLSGTTASASRTLTPGQTYYIRVRPFYNYTGTYRIGFTASTAAPTQ